MVSIPLIAGTLRNFDDVSLKVSTLPLTAELACLIESEVSSA
jgi:hypothetical protein